MAMLKAENLKLLKRIEAADSEIREKRRNVRFLTKTLARINTLRDELNAESEHFYRFTSEMSSFREHNIDILAEILVSYDVLPRMLCEEREKRLLQQEKVIRHKKQELFWRQKKFFVYESLVQQREKSIDNVLQMARYLRDQTSDQAYLVWAEKFSKLRQMARYMDSLRFETADLLEELKYLSDLNLVELAEYEKNLESKLEEGEMGEKCWFP